MTADFRWDDLGSWESLTRSRPVDPDGNWTVGSTYSVDSRDSVVWAEEGPVVLFGVENLVIARSGGITLVTTREQSAHLKDLLRRLPPGLMGDTAARQGIPAPVDEERDPVRRPES